jgi:Cof subfamily protein (haloacid dehalogenase superfamily)
MGSLYKLNKIKLIVTDLDNTLLKRDKTISEYTADVFCRVKERGILTAFATARDYRFITEHITPLFKITPDIIIADNGALAFHEGKYLYKKMIPKKTVNALLPHFEPLRCVSAENAYYISGEFSNDHWSIGKKGTVISDFSKNIENDAFFLDGNIEKAKLFLTGQYPDIRIVAYSDIIAFCTLVHREATKLNALKAVKNALSIDIGDIAAFGDDYSDVDMLSYCGYGIAVANAINECKSAAGYICGDCDEDGAAHWIEENCI